MFYFLVMVFCAVFDVYLWRLMYVHWERHSRSFLLYYWEGSLLSFVHIVKELYEIESRPGHQALT